MDKKSLVPLFQRNKNSHKYDYGHVLVIGGSSGMVGAPLLAGQAALRIGAGLVTIASSAKVIAALERRVVELMTFSFTTGQTGLARLLSFIADRHVSVLIIGNGMAVDSEASVLVRELLSETSLPAIVDGGGLAALAAFNFPRSSPLIVTPHGGEFSRLVGHKVEELRIRDEAEAFALKSGATIVVKGHLTYVAMHNRHTYVNSTGNPGLATAGTGDVLAGIIGGLLAQGLPAFDAATDGVYLHGLAGDLAAHVTTEPGLIASDVIAAVPSTLKQVAADLSGTSHVK